MGDLHGQGPSVGEEVKARIGGLGSTRDGRSVGRGTRTDGTPASHDAVTAPEELDHPGRDKAALQKPNGHLGDPSCRCRSDSPARLQTLLLGQVLTSCSGKNIVVAGRKPYDR